MINHLTVLNVILHIHGLVPERRNSIANALELRLSCTNPSIFSCCLHSEAGEAGKDQVQCTVGCSDLSENVKFYHHGGQRPPGARPPGASAGLGSGTCGEYMMMARECFPDYWPFVRGIHRSPVDSPHIGPVIWSFDVFFMFSWTCCWINSYQWSEIPWHSYDITGINTARCHNLFSDHRAWINNYIQ